MKKIFSLLIACGFFQFVNGQVLISSDILPGPPHPNAMLEIRSFSKGFLLPRVSSYQRTYAMALSPNGMMTYDTDSLAVVLKSNGSWFKLLHNYNSGNITFGDITTSGSKLRWLADKSAFRVGYFDNTNWDPNYIGYYSSAFGHSNAIGDYSTGLGRSNASGHYSLASGLSLSPGNFSVALGASIASGDSSIAAGNSTASGKLGAAFGRSTAGGVCGTALGYSSANGNYAAAFGNSVASNSYSTASGFSSVSGYCGVALGYSIANGHYSTALGYSSTTGTFSFAAGSSSATADTSIALGHATASGVSSIAIGGSAKSAEINAIAIGANANAKQWNAVALGYYSTAWGWNSVALGSYADSRGYSSVAFGNTITKSPYCFTAGIFNDTSETITNYYGDADGRIFQIGNGSATRSNALTILRNGNAGFGNINNPIEKLEVAGAIKIADATASAANGTMRYTAAGGFEGKHNGSWQALSGGSGGSSLWTLNGNDIQNTNSASVFFTNDTSTSSAKLWWIPSKKAFRAGYQDKSYFINWDSIGNNSAAFGYSAAQGDAATAGGYSSAAGAYSTAFGYAYAKGPYSSAFGGSYNYGDSSFAGGYSTLRGNLSTSFGKTLNKSYGSFTSGVFNDTADAPNAAIPNSGDRVFQIGNGTTSARTNAITILRNGNTGIGNINNPLQKLEVSGAIKIADIAATTNPVNGIIAYNGTDFMGYHNGWKSLTESSYKAGSGIVFSADTIKTIPQTLSLSGSNLSLSNGGGTVTLPSGGGGGSLTLPFFSAYTNSGNNTFELENNGSGSGSVIKARISNPSSFSSAIAIEAVNRGYLGTALSVVDSSSSGNALKSYSLYTKAINAITYNGTAVYGEATNNGSAAYFTCSNTSNQALTTNRGLVTLGSVSDKTVVTINGSLKLGVTNVATSTYAVAQTDAIIIATTNATITLPFATAYTGVQFTIKRNTTAGNVVINTVSSQTIDGALSYTLAANYKYVTLTSDGSNWLIIGGN